MSLEKETQHIHFITYGNNHYTRSKELLEYEAIETGWFDSISTYNDTDLTSEFKKKHATILNMPRGGGYWIWKYDIITEKLNTISENDILVYLDAGCGINKNGRKRFLEYIDILNKDENQCGIISFDNGCKERIWTTKEIFNYFNVDDTRDDIKNSGQLMATIMIMKKTSHLEMLFEKYNDVLSSNSLLFTDHYNKNNQEDEFKDNRHDQSIFSLIRKIYGSTIVLDDETWWPNDNFNVPEAQDKPFWAIRRRDNTILQIGSEGKRILDGLVKSSNNRLFTLYRNSSDCHVIIRSHFLNQEAKWNSNISKPYILWSGESYDVPHDNTLCNYLHISTTYLENQPHIYVPYVLDSPYLYKERRISNNVRPFLVAYCSSNKVAIRELLFNKFVEKAGIEKCHALGKCYGGKYKDSQRKVEGTWQSGELIEEYTKYKFVFAIENKKVNGYVTEKIMNAFHSGAIPIYWGSSNINELFNPCAFINVGDFNSFEECVDHVLSLTDEQIENMLREPIYGYNKDLIHLLDKDYNSKHNNKLLPVYLQKIASVLKK